VSLTEGYQAASAGRELGIMKMTFVSGVTILRFVDNANEFLKRVEVFRRPGFTSCVPPPPAT
jgi:hypothetical protein